MISVVKRAVALCGGWGVIIIMGDEVMHSLVLVVLVTLFVVLRARCERSVWRGSEVRLHSKQCATTLLL